MPLLSTIQRQLIATALLLLFLSATAVKLLHSHESANIVCQTGEEQLEVEKANCSLCDYHFAKDAQLLIHTANDTFCILPSSESSTYESEVTSSIGLNYSDRGPPSVI